MKPEQYLFGCAYYDEYTPESRTDTDFQMMKDAGMNVIRIAESTWSTWEPEEGRFDFTSLIRMLKGARKYGLQVIIGTPTYAFPSWLLKKGSGCTCNDKRRPSSVWTKAAHRSAQSHIQKTRRESYQKAS